MLPRFILHQAMTELYASMPTETVLRSIQLQFAADKKQLKAVADRPVCQAYWYQKFTGTSFHWYQKLVSLPPA